ncbi:hypothetical protein SHIRM173S_11788 [Streptomyces hirsutus]
MAGTAQQRGRGGGQAQRRGVDVPGQHRQRAGTADQHRHRLDRAVQRVEDEQTGDRPRELRLPVVLPEPQQAHHQEQIAQYVADGDVRVALGQQRRHDGLPPGQHALDRQGDGGRGEQQRDVREQRPGGLRHEGAGQDGRRQPSDDERTAGRTGRGTASADARHEPTTGSGQPAGPGRPTGSGQGQGHAVTPGFVAETDARVNAYRRPDDTRVSAPCGVTGDCYGPRRPRDRGRPRPRGPARPQGLSGGSSRRQWTGYPSSWGERGLVRSAARRRRASTRWGSPLLMGVPPLERSREWGRSRELGGVGNRRQRRR